MDAFGLIRHPLDRFSLTGSMEDLDARGMEAADHLMTMIGDLRFREEDIRGTCARYFCFIDTVWFSHLCDTAHIDHAKLQTYLRCTENGVAGELDDILNDGQTSFGFLKSGNQRGEPGKDADAPETHPELLSPNKDRSDSHTGCWESSIQKPTPKGSQASDSELPGNAAARREA
jgi:hypothetical protein